MGRRHSHTATRNIGVALVLNFVFTVVQLVGGFLTGSVAILSNAVHDLADSFTLGLSLLFEKMATRKSNAKFSYGYRRLSLLSAVISGVIILFACGGILYKAIPTIANPTVPHTGGMIVLALLGITINIIAAFQLNKGSTSNEKILTWHLLEDVLAWTAVLIVAVIMMFYHLPILDPLLSICVIAIVIRGVGKNLWGVLKLFLQGVPGAVDLRQLRESIMKRIEDVIDLHDTHVWSLDGASHVMTMHAVVKNNTELKKLTDIKGKIKSIVSELGEFHITLELENEEENCLAKKCIEL